MANPDRLSALDTTFLHLEDNGPSHMHVASLMVFNGEAPTLRELVDHVEGRLHLVPRYRQRLAFVPYAQGRPVWVDDPHFNPYYHIRTVALPSPGDDSALKTLAGEVFSQRLVRSRPLWELWLVERLAGRRFALIAKAHHALVDGVSGVDITTVLFDREPRAGERRARMRPGWVARPLPSEVKLLSDALRERATLPSEVALAAGSLLGRPRKLLQGIGGSLASIGSFTWAGISSPAPPSPFNVDIGPHRRYTFLLADLARFRAIKDELGGTLNDVVLSAVSLALGDFLRAEGQQTDELTLRAMVPVSVRAEAEHGALGNRVAAMWVPLPVGVKGARAVHSQIAKATRSHKQSGQAVGAQVLTNLAGFAPPTILSQAARLQARQRFFNLVVTNVPGPQFPLHLLEGELAAIYPVVPLAHRQALGIAVMSYNGTLGFGLLGDYDVLGNLDALGRYLERAIAALAKAAGLAESSARAGKPARVGRGGKKRPLAPARG